MKKLFLVVMLLALVAGLAYSQAARNVQRVVMFNALTYTNSDKDTSGTITLGSLGRVTFRARSRDSANVVYAFDYRTLGNTSWSTATAAVGDTLTTTTATGTYYQITLRDNATDRIPGVSTQIRIRANFESTGNSAAKDATAANYHDGWIEY